MLTGKITRSRNLRWMLALRPQTLALDHFHVYYLKRFLANGVYIGPGGMFVKDMAKLLKVENGIENQSHASLRMNLAMR